MAIEEAENAAPIMTGEQNLRLIREIEANREFMLAIYRQNPALLANAEQRIKDLFMPLPSGPADQEAAFHPPGGVA